MTLKELSVEYRKSGELIKERILSIVHEMSIMPLSESERIINSRRLTILTAMARDAIEISTKLSNYYGRD